MDVSRLGYSQLIESLADVRRSRAVLDARETTLLAALNRARVPGGSPDPELDKQWVREDVACALTIPAAVAGEKLRTASDLVSRFPATVTAMAETLLGLEHARRLVEATQTLTDRQARAVEGEVLDKGFDRTAVQFANSVRRAVLRVDPHGANRRHQRARADRYVAFRPADNGMTDVWATLPAEQAAAMHDRIRRLADSWRGTDGRDADQRRADAFAALCLGTAGSAAPACGPSVQVIVSLSTLLGMDQQPAELDGHGPIPAVLARAIAFDPTGTWRRLVTDHAGQLVDVTAATYRPPARLATLVEVRDRTCVFYGCNRRATTCEIDHLTAWTDGGTTCAGNLQPLCRRHHHLKHNTGWQVKRLDNGTTRWRSPSGDTYDRPPPDPLPADHTVIKSGDPPPC